MPAAGRVVKGDKADDDAKSERAKPQHQAKQPDFTHYGGKWNALAGAHAHRGVAQRDPPGADAGQQDKTAHSASTPSGAPMAMAP